MTSTGKHSDSLSQPQSSPSQLPNKFPQIPPSGIPQILFQRPPILVAVSPLNLHQQASIPVQPHQTRDQKFVAEFVFGVAMVSATVASISYVHDCVMEE